MMQPSYQIAISNPALAAIHAANKARKAKFWPVKPIIIPPRVPASVDVVEEPVVKEAVFEPLKIISVEPVETKPSIAEEFSKLIRHHFTEGRSTAEIAKLVYAMESTITAVMAAQNEIEIEAAIAIPQKLIRPIQKEVAEKFQISFFDLIGQGRQANFVFARQFAMWRCKTETLRSFPEIARYFGNRDHTTVLHAVRKIQAMIDRGEIDERGNKIRTVS